MRSPWLWVTTVYFAEGYPYALVNDLPQYLFKEMGASLAAVGLTSLFDLPWNVKLAWAPLVDAFETKRRWILGVEVLLVATLAALTASAVSSEWLGVMSVVLLVAAVLSATHDIGIDGLYMEALDEDDQSRFVGLRAMPYKAAGLLVGGPLLVFVAWRGWRTGLATATALMALLAVVHAVALPRNEQRRRPLSDPLKRRAPRLALVVAIVLAVVLLERQLGWLRAVWAQIAAAVGGVPVLGKIRASGWVALAVLAILATMVLLRGRILRRLENSDSIYGRAFTQFLAQPKVGRILAFTILFRTGESFLIKMKWPFLRDELGMSLADFGWLNGTVGVVASFAATMVGGMLIAKHGLRRWIWPFVIAQNALNVLYVWLAYTGATSLGTIGVVIMLEQAGAGLGTAVFMVYLMRCCDLKYKASHFAILTSLMSLSFTFAGVASGFLAEAIGFTGYFALSLVATIPGTILVWFVPHIDGREEVTPTADA